MPVVVLTSGTTWTAVQAALDKVECWGGGGTGTAAVNPGGGGAYALRTSVTVTNGASIPITIGSSGVDTNWNSGSIIAKSGGTTTAGGAAASCTPSTGAFSGGTTGAGGQGGGGSAGKDGAGIGGNSSTNFTDGGRGDATTGGLGGTGAAGAAGAANTEGGGGGAANTGGGTAGAGGVPGGGGGQGAAANGAGAVGQIRITYTVSASTPFIPEQQTDRFRPAGFLAILQQDYTAPISNLPEAVSVDRWLQPLSSPVRSRVLPIAAMAAFALVVMSPAAPPAVTVSQWQQPFSQPVPRLSSHAALFGEPWTPFVPVVATTPVVPAQQPDVVRRAGVHASQLPAWAGPLSTAPETTTVDRWHRPLATPVWSRVLSAAQQPAATAPLSEAPETVTIDRWLQPLSTPVWTRSAVASQQGSFAWGIFTPPVAQAVSIGWLSPLALPVQPRPSPPSGAVAPVSLAPETVSEDRWHQPFSLPVWPQRGLAAHQQPASAWSGFTPAAVVPISLGWLPSLEVPRLPQRAQPASGAVQPVSIAPESTTVDRWFMAFSTPVRRAPQTARPDGVWPPFTPAAAVVPSFAWWQQTVDVVRRGGISVVQQAPFWGNSITPVPPNPPPSPVVVPVSVPGPADGLDDAERARKRWLEWAATRQRKAAPAPPPAVVKKAPVNFGAPLSNVRPPRGAPETGVPTVDTGAILQANMAAMLAQQPALIEAARRKREMDDDDDDLAIILGA